MANNNDCIFCKIVSGKIPCYKIYEDKETLAFLDAFPQMKGQVLLIPKQHISPYMFNIDDKIYCSLLLTAKKIAKAIDKSLKPVKTGLVIE
ncbi:diadenosine tetraphosphate hydrolase, partial [Candidatus Pacearchaeota archaeon CG10_big_fil_rev_8_21_14_0_10_31_59]